MVLLLFECLSTMCTNIFTPSMWISWEQESCLVMKKQRKAKTNTEGEGEQEEGDFEDDLVL